MMEELSLNILDVAENSVAAGASLVEIEISEIQRQISSVSSSPTMVVV